MLRKRINANLLLLSIAALLAVSTARGITSNSSFLLLPIVLLAGYVWWRFALRYKVLSLFVLVTLFQAFFKIIDVGISKRFTEDIALVLMLVVVAVQFPVIVRNLTKNERTYTWSIIGFGCMVILSVIIGSYLKFGQPVSSGLFPARKYFLIISYFFLAGIGFNQKDSALFMRYLTFLGGVLALLILVDVRLLGGGKIFDFVPDQSKMRVGDIRFSVASFLVVIACVHAALKSKQEKIPRLKWGYMCITAICLIEIMTCNMTRARIIALIAVLLFIYLGKSNSKKLVILPIVISIAALFADFSPSYLTNTTLGRMSRLTQHEVTAPNSGHKSGHINIRIRDIGYFSDLWLHNSPVFGVGVFSDTRFMNDPMAYAELKYGYILADVMGFDTFVRFGIVGGALLIFLTIKSLVDLRHARHHIHDPEQLLIANTLFYLFVYRLLSPSLGNILTTNTILYFGMFFYFIPLLKRQAPTE